VQLRLANLAGNVSTCRTATLEVSHTTDRPLLGAPASVHPTTTLQGGDPLSCASGCVPSACAGSLYALALMCPPKLSSHSLADSVQLIGWAGCLQIERRRLTAARAAGTVDGPRADKLLELAVQKVEAIET
jgi:hypothetical protein